MLTGLIKTCLNNYLRLPISIILALASTACSGPKCNVTRKASIGDMKIWLKSQDQEIKIFRTWRRIEDYRDKKLFVSEPDLDNICELECANARAQIQKIVHYNFIEQLKKQPGYIFVQDPSQADYEVVLKVASVRELRWFQRINFFPDMSRYTFWIRITNMATGNTAFWAKGLDNLDDDHHALTYDRVINQINNYERNSE